MTVTSHLSHMTKTTQHRQQAAEEDGRMAVESYNYRRKLCVLSKIYSSWVNIVTVISANPTKFCKTHLRQGELSEE